MIIGTPADEPVVRELRDFDVRSGSWLERLLFNHRRPIVFLCLVLTVVLGVAARRLRLNAGFERMIPARHTYVVNYREHGQDLRAVGNAVRVAVENTRGTILDPAYLETLRRLSDDVLLLPGVDRPYMKSLWTPATRWLSVTEDGLEGGPVIPDDYDGSPASLGRVRANVERSGEIGQLVAANFRSSVVLAPLLERDPETGKALDYARFEQALERLRTKYGGEGVALHVTGFAQAVGDLMAGLRQMLLFFAVAPLVALAALYWHTRCLRSAVLVVLCSLTAAAWLLGLLPLLGYGLDPYTILVPFLVFAIGVSHGAQKMNGITRDIGRGTHRLVAARYTFRRLFVAGLSALLASAAGFAVLGLIPIRVIQDLAVAASIGVGLLIFTNLALLPILLSYVGVSPRAAAASVVSARMPHRVLAWFAAFTDARWARGVISVAAGLGLVGLMVGRELRIGDLDPGAPELRADSRYNRDSAFMTANYGASSDVLVVMVTTAQYRCAAYDTVARTDALEWELRQVPGVVSTGSIAGLSRRAAAGLNEGSLKWYDVPRNQGLLNAIAAQAPRELRNEDCDLLPVYIYLADHEAETLRRVTAAAGAFARRNDTTNARFLLGAGNAGFEAATNEVVGHANYRMLALVYAAVAALCLVTFRSWRGVFCAALPLALTSVLCEALMVLFGIGVKVATLPVVAVGVGIGVDYTLYVLSVTLAGLRRGLSLPEAYREALLFTGNVVVLAGLTLSVSVGTWAFSRIKFQADMGRLLAFMFAWNMIGTLILLPALMRFVFPRSATEQTAGTA